MKSLHRGLVVIGLWLAAFAGIARADTILFEFEVDFVSGPLSGQTATGEIAVLSTDCAGLDCTGLFTPAGPAHVGNAFSSQLGPTLTLQGIEITVGGTTFLASSDSGFPDFPEVAFDHSVLTLFDFFADASVPALSIHAEAGIPGQPLTASGLFFDGVNSSFIGGFTQIGAAAAPEPGTAPLLLGALIIGLVLAHRRERGSSGLAA